MIFDAEKEDYFLEDVKPFLGKVEFKNLAHNYGGIKALNNVNFKVYSGQKIALVGHSGSGKSTLMNILLRFVDHTGGDIYIDDINICEYSKRTYRKNIGIILQTPILFAGTIYDNISYSKNISKKEAVNLLVKVGGENLLSKCSKGIDTVLSRSGNNLSLGEKQLISFARILAYNPSILVLDEATANIDTETEEIFSKALEVISENKTLFVIAHRISTIKDSDNIIVLKNGEIIESGTHNSLLENKGYYSEMCQYNL